MFGVAEFRGTREPCSVQLLSARVWVQTLIAQGPSREFRRKFPWNATLGFSARAEHQRRFLIRQLA
jgi:hypothetical protein